MIKVPWTKLYGIHGFASKKNQAVPLRRAVICRHTLQMPLQVPERDPAHVTPTRLAAEDRHLGGLHLLLRDALGGAGSGRVEAVIVHELLVDEHRLARWEALRAKVAFVLVLVTL